MRGNLMTVLQTATVRGEELVAPVEVRAAVVMLVESGEVPVGCAPRPGDWTTIRANAGIGRIISPTPVEDEPIEDAHRNVEDLKRMLAL
jgi:hypothetical protein